MLSNIRSAALLGIDAYPVEVEVDICPGLPTFQTVGLPDTAVKESKDRVKSAITNSQFSFPIQRITVNLAPADTKKEGPSFDLPMAVGILVASGRLPQKLVEGYWLVGELALDGKIRPIRGALSIALAARDCKVKGLLVPAENAKEAGVVQEVPVFAVKNLKETFDFLSGTKPMNPIQVNIEEEFKQHSTYKVDFSDVKGQENAKRALEIGAAGGHNILLVGPPGSGKTMLTKRLPTILPPLSLEEAIQSTKVHSIAGTLGRRKALMATRAFRSPHHTISDAGLIGWRKYPQTWRGQPIAQRGSFLGRIPGIQQERVGGPAPTLGRRPGDDFSRPIKFDLPGSVHVSFCHESMPLRLLHRSFPGMHLYAASDPQVPEQDFGASFGPH